VRSLRRSGAHPYRTDSCRTGTYRAYSAVRAVRHLTDCSAKLARREIAQLVLLLPLPLPLPMCLSDDAHLTYAMASLAYGTYVQASRLVGLVGLVRVVSLVAASPVAVIAAQPMGSHRIRWRRRGGHRRGLRSLGTHAPSKPMTTPNCTVCAVCALVPSYRAALLAHETRLGSPHGRPPTRVPYDISMLPHTEALL
jgi:hypothetical protein